MKPQAEFEIDVHDIDESGKRFGFPVRHEWLRSVLSGTSVSAFDGAAEGCVDVHAHKQGLDIVLRGRIRATLAAECSRCLEPSRIDVDSELASLLTARRADMRTVPEVLDLTPEDLDREYFSGDRIVLDDVVREHLLLEVPIQPLCARDCPGIALPAAVAGPRELAPARGVDPRFAPLLKLVGKVPTEE